MLPLPELNPRLTAAKPNHLAAQLARLSYPGFTHRKKAGEPLNPAALVATALAHSDLDPRLMEALPWILATFHDLDGVWLSAQCRLLNPQNRLGYLVSLAMKLAKPAQQRTWQRHYPNWNGRDSPWKARYAASRCPGQNETGPEKIGRHTLRIGTCSPR